jgi:hypothetical protein
MLQNASVAARKEDKTSGETTQQSQKNDEHEQGNHKKITPSELQDQPLRDKSPAVHGHTADTSSFRQEKENNYGELDEEALAIPEDEEGSEEDRPGAVSVPGLNSRMGISQNQDETQSHHLDVTIMEEDTTRSPRLPDPSMIVIPASLVVERDQPGGRGSSQIELANVLGVDDSKQREARQKNKMYVLLSFICVLVLGAAVTAGVLVSKSSSRDEQFYVRAVNTLSPSMTSSPTTTPVLKDPSEVIISILGQATPLPLSARKAFRWLVDEDESGILQDPRTPEWRIFQRYAVAELFFSNGGRFWHVDLDFLSSSHECEWNRQFLLEFDEFEFTESYGFTGDPVLLHAGVAECDDNKRVQVLRFLGVGLQNEIPTAIMYLPELISLDLGGGLLTGTLPTELRVATKLETLSLANNILIGTLPSELLSLSNLKQLFLVGNGFTGTLPCSLGKLSNLDHFSVSSNLLSGSLPEDYNQWTSIGDVFLQDNLFTGTLPSSWYKWSNLEIFDVSRNLLAGPLPDEYSQWTTSFRYFYIWNNVFTGTLPIPWSEWSNLERFDVSGNSLSGPLPYQYSQLSSIRDVYFEWNVFTGTLPSSWSGWSNLERFDVSGNSLAGPLPDQYSQWTTSIRLVQIWFNAFTGTLPSSWSEWSNLEYFDVDENELIGSLPEEYSQWTSINEVYLQMNSFTGTLPTSWNQWSNLQLFTVHGNFLDGSLPEEYIQWRSLTEVSFALNDFTGTLPSSWSRWADTIQVVFLQENNLLGILPEAYGNWINVQEVNFTNNCLEGPVPNSYKEQWSLILGCELDDVLLGNQETGDHCLLFGNHTT